MDLKSLKVVTKTAEADFPGLDGFTVTIGAISREMSRKLREESEVTRIDPRTRGQVKELDENKFLDKFAKEAIKGWSGLKYKHLEDLMLVDLSEVEDTEALVPYTHENALELLKESTTFDNWLNEVVFSLETFRS